MGVASAPFLSGCFAVVPYPWPSETKLVDSLGGSNLGVMRLGFTLGENTVRGVGGVAGARVDGRVLSIEEH